MRLTNIELGTELKLNIHIDPIDGQTINDFNYEIEAYCTPTKKIIKGRPDTIRRDNDIIVCLDTKEVGTGELICKVTAYIHDGDFKDAHRTEVVVVKTGINIVRTA